MTSNLEVQKVSFVWGLVQKTLQGAWLQPSFSCQYVQVKWRCAQTSIACSSLTSNLECAIASYLAWGWEQGDGKGQRWPWPHLFRMHWPHTISLLHCSFLSTPPFPIRPNKNYVYHPLPHPIFEAKFYKVVCGCFHGNQTK